MLREYSPEGLCNLQEFMSNQLEYTLQRNPSQSCIANSLPKSKKRKLSRRVVLSNEKLVPRSQIFHFFVLQSDTKNGVFWMQMEPQWAYGVLKIPNDETFATRPLQGHRNLNQLKQDCVGRKANVRCWINAYSKIWGGAFSETISQLGHRHESWWCTNPQTLSQ